MVVGQHRYPCDQVVQSDLIDRFGSAVSLEQRGRANPGDHVVDVPGPQRRESMGDIAEQVRGHPGHAESDDGPKQRVFGGADVDCCPARRGGLHRQVMWWPTRRLRQRLGQLIEGHGSSRW